MLLEVNNVPLPYREVENKQNADELDKNKAKGNNIYKESFTEDDEANTKISSC